MHSTAREPWVAMRVTHRQFGTAQGRAWPAVMVVGGHAAQLAREGGGGGERGRAAAACRHGWTHGSCMHGPSRLITHTHAYINASRRRQTLHAAPAPVCCTGRPASVCCITHARHAHGGPPWQDSEPSSRLLPAATLTRWVAQDHHGHARGHDGRRVGAVLAHALQDDVRVVVQVGVARRADLVVERPRVAVALYRRIGQGRAGQA